MWYHMFSSYCTAAVIWIREKFAFLTACWVNLNIPCNLVFMELIFVLSQVGSSIVYYRTIYPMFELCLGRTESFPTYMVVSQVEVLLCQVPSLIILCAYYT